MELEGMLIARGEKDLLLLPRMANRHGLVAGATGTGKTVTLQVMAEHFSRIGVPVFMADVKGDLAGVSQPGLMNPKIQERIVKLKLGDYAFEGSPVTFWDIFGEQGHPVRTTVSDMGPLLLSRLLNLNDVQSGVMSIVFRIADDSGLHLLDFKDLRALAQYAGDHPDEFETEYGRISPASIGTIQRNLLTLEDQGAEVFFGEPALELEDLMQTDGSGRGQINILASDKLMLMPRAYSTFLLWLMSELFERLPEVGDQDKPRLVFFFDEAHLLFTDAPQVLLEKIEQVVRLIRSKGVGIYFVTQNPLDIPDVILGQLGNRVQHALRAFTPRDQKAVKSAAETFRQNPKVDVETAITQLATGEALVSFLDEKGQPGIVERAYVLPPHSRIGPIMPAERQAIIHGSVLFGHYEKSVDRESAYEMLKARAEKAAAAAQAQAQAQAEARQAPYQYPPPSGQGRSQYPQPQAPRRPAGRQRDTLIEAMAKSAARSVGSNLGRQILRGVLGSIFGGKR
ncbi:MAG: helicase HerA-like domain-containing protein [Candidatus Aminicenantales bacterium]